MRSRIAWVVAASVAWSMTASGAWADVAPPSSWACDFKKTGDTCDVVNEQNIPTGSQGVCVQSTCYSGHPTPWDGGAFDCPDGSTCSPWSAGQMFVRIPWGCVVCEDAGAPESGTPAEPGSDAGSGGSAASDDGGVGGGSGGTALSQGAGGGTATTAPAPTSNSSSCSVPGGLARTIGPWALAGSVSILLLLKRRRRS
jgi:hypothetical protein